MRRANISLMTSDAVMVNQSAVMNKSETILCQPPDRRKPERRK
jgi:hypothetical protein